MDTSKACVGCPQEPLLSCPADQFDFWYLLPCVLDDSKVFVAGNGGLGCTNGTHSSTAAFRYVLFL